MLSQQTIDIVKQTAPAIAQTGPKLTAHFYDRLFRHHPQLMDVFNMTHQSSGAQREALFNAIVAYANNIENLPALLPAVEKIAQKHTSLLVSAEQYAVVGEHLLATIDELLSPGDAVLSAWGEAYGVLADVFIQREQEIYDNTEMKKGGWRGTRSFIVSNKHQESQTITSFTLTPSDGLPVMDFCAGQYLGLHLQAPGILEHKEIRQYSLCGQNNQASYRIAVKRDGKASQYLHQHIHIGDTIEAVPPAGDFTYQSKPETPIVLVSGGIGLTPLVSMLYRIQIKTAPVYWLHATEDTNQHAFHNEVSHLIDELPRSHQFIWYKQGTSPTNHAPGYMDFSVLENDDLLTEADFYVCGPTPFMQYAIKSLTDMGVTRGQIYYENFGPHKSI